MSDEKLIDKTKAFEIAAECLKPITDAEPFEIITAAGKIAAALVEYGYPKQYIRETVQVFSEMIEIRLRTEDINNGPWETEIPFGIFDEITEKLGELEKAIVLHLNTTRDEGGDALKLKCVDIAKLAMMLFSHFHSTTRHNRRGRAVHAIPRP